MRRIRLTESQLNKVILESAKRLIRESKRAHKAKQRCLVMLGGSEKRYNEFHNMLFGSQNRDLIDTPVIRFEPRILCDLISGDIDEQEAKTFIERANLAYEAGLSLNKLKLDIPTSFLLRQLSEMMRCFRHA